MFTLLGVIALVLRERTVNKTRSDGEELVEKNTPSTMTSDGREIDGRTEHLSSEEPKTSGCPVHVDGHSEVLLSPSTAPTLQTPDHAAAQNIDDVPTVCAMSDCSEDDVLQAAVPLLADLCARVLQDTEPQSCQQQDMEKTITGREIDGRTEYLSSEEPNTSGCPVHVDGHSEVLLSPSTAPTLQTPDHAAAQNIDDVPTVCAMSDCSEDDVFQAAVPLLADLCARVLQDTEPQSCQQQDMEKTITGRDINGRTEHLSAEEPNTSGCPVHVDDHSEVLHSPSTAPTLQISDHAAAQSIDNVPTACATSDSSEDDVLQAAVPSLADLCERVFEKKKNFFVINSRKYEIGEELGEGGFGTVYAATRLDDGLQVAVKHCPMFCTKFISIDGFAQPLPIEIALQILVNQGPRVPEILELLDWQVEQGFYLMVLERPIPCQPLSAFIKSYVGPIKEDAIRFIMKQAVFAAQTCCQRKVLHRDIKLENLLINPDTLEVKLIDFGCGEILQDEAYTAYCGTEEFCPPEFQMTGKYHGEPATVWSLGLVLFVMLFWKFPTLRELNRIMTKDIEGLSEECCDFMRCCLKTDPRERIELERLNLHAWLKTKEEKISETNYYISFK
ncbi:uncharacterized protein [Danio rerio]|uniref:non-specific serine/threonine protein kinase n=1 Tax=Danio rerio TaxID=7955 RepID=A0AB32T5J7_DANRE